MKILIISSSTWDNANSFGNTFSNLFEGMKKIEVYNIACGHGVFNNNIVKQAIQLTDKSVLKSIYKWGFDPCWEVQESVVMGGMNKELSQTARKKRRTILFMIRDMIWKLGRWKKSKTLTAFLEEIKPDVIYLPIYASPYMCDFQQYIIKKLDIPVVGHISDDVYGYPPKGSLLAKWYRVGLRKKIKKLINTCSYLEVFAKNMQEEYSKLFNKPCYLIGKGILSETVKDINVQAPIGEPMHFVYTGNIGDDRYKALVDIGYAISKGLGRENAVLDIYSTTPLTNQMREAIHGCEAIEFHGGISKKEVMQVQKDADFLVHVEGFSQTAIFSAKMSFSTKIIDYMMMSKAILAYGPQEVNSIQVLKESEVGLTAISSEELETVITNITTNNVDYALLTKNTKKYLLESRDIEKIQAGIYQRMSDIVGER